jgi:hypothetical protein
MNLGVAMAMNTVPDLNDPAHREELIAFLEDLLTNADQPDVVVLPAERETRDYLRHLIAAQQRRIV